MCKVGKMCTLVYKSPFIIIGLNQTLNKVKFLIFNPSILQRIVKSEPAGHCAPLG